MTSCTGILRLTSYFFQQVKTGYLGKFIISYTILFQNNNVGLILRMSKSSFINNKLVQLGFEPENFRLSFWMKNWLSKLFKLSPRLSMEFDKYSSLLRPNNETTIICAQIRTHDVDEKKNASTALMFWRTIKKYYINRELVNIYFFFQINNLVL
jgi:hypothetical protein